MSISQINKLFQNKGCNIVVSCILGISVISMLGVGGRGCAADQEQQRSQERGLPIVTAGDYEITKDTIDMLTQRQMEQFGAAELPASFKLQIEGSSLNGQIANGLALILAKQQGVDFSDSVLKKRIVQAQTEAIRSQLEGQGQLKPGASEQDFENAFKAMSKRSWVDARKELETTVDQKLADPNARQEVLAGMAMILLTDKNKGRFTPTEASLKAEYDTLELKRIDIMPADAGKEGVAAKAKRILGEIKAGMSFEAAMDKYNTAPAAKGKKKSDETQSLRKDSIDNNPPLKPLLDLKPGGISNVIEGPGASQIYKLIKRGIELPKDFDKQKASLMESKARNDAARSVSDEIKKLDTPANVKWKNEGYHLLHDLLALDSVGKLAPADRTTNVRTILDKAMKLIDDPLSGDIASSIARMALNELGSSLSPADKDKYQIPVLEGYIQNHPEVDVKIELVEAYLAKGEKEKTGRAIIQAADAISINYDETAHNYWSRINKNTGTAREKQLISVGDATKVNKLYTDWLKEYAAELDRKKKEEAARKATEEELKKQEINPKPSGGKNTPKQPTDPPKKSDSSKPTGKPK